MDVLTIQYRLSSRLRGNRQKLTYYLHEASTSRVLHSPAQASTWPLPAPKQEYAQNRVSAPHLTSCQRQCPQCGGLLDRCKQGSSGLEPMPQRGKTLLS